MKILILLLSLAGFYCNTHPSASSQPGRTDIADGVNKYALPTDTIETKIGAEFRIEIRATLGTGNRWMLEDSLDKNYLTLIGSTTITDSTEMAAKPDLQTFVFKAIKTGSSTISFVYKRPWKKNTEANAERKRYFIKIT
jgi:predicted secreted protein